MSQRKVKFGGVQRNGAQITDKFEQRSLLLDAIAQTGANVFRQQVAGHALALVIPGDTEFTGTVEQCTEYWQAVETHLLGLLETVRKVNNLPPPLTQQRAHAFANGTEKPTEAEVTYAIDCGKQLAASGADMPHALDAMRVLRTMNSADGELSTGMLRAWYMRDVALGNAHSYPGNAKGEA